MQNVSIYVYSEPKSPWCRRYRCKYFLISGKHRRDGEGVVEKGIGEYTPDLNRKTSDLFYVRLKNTPTLHQVNLIAIIKALERMKNPSVIEILTNDFYIANGHRDMAEWLKNGWKRKNGEPLKNVKLWKRIHELEAAHAVCCKHTPFVNLFFE